MKVRNVKKAVFIFLGVILTYVLSVGPAYRLLGKHIITQRTFSAMYAPVIYTCKKNEHLDNWFHRYGDFWYSMWDQPENAEQKK
jgi:hypothetical protein